jgi:hypothetical protein
MSKLKTCGGHLEPYHTQPNFPKDFPFSETISLLQGRKTFLQNVTTVNTLYERERSKKKMKTLAKIYDHFILISMFCQNSKAQEKKNYRIKLVRTYELSTTSLFIFSCSFFFLFQCISFHSLRCCPPMQLHCNLTCRSYTAVFYIVIL